MSGCTYSLYKPTPSGQGVNPSAGTMYRKTYPSKRRHAKQEKATRTTSTKDPSSSCRETLIVDTRIRVGDLELGHLVCEVGPTPSPSSPTSVTGSSSYLTTPSPASTTGPASLRAQGHFTWDAPLRSLGTKTMVSP